MTRTDSICWQVDLPKPIISCIGELQIPDHMLRPRELCLCSQVEDNKKQPEFYYSLSNTLTDTKQGQANSEDQDSGPADARVL